MPTHNATPAVRLHLDAGPDAGRTIIVRDGAVTLGRAGGPGYIADPSLEPHHVLVDVRRRVLVQLTGRIPARNDGTPIGSGLPIRRGAVVELGASRIVIDGRDAVPSSPTAVVLGVDAAPGPGRPAVPITVDVSVVRRVLVAGPCASALAAALATRAARLGPVSLTAGFGRVRCGPVSRCLLIAHVPDPDAGWPDRELPRDAVVVSVGGSWRASIVRRGSSGDLVLQRFHAAGSGPNRALVAQEVPRARPELRRDVTGVPEPARRE